MQKLCFLLVTCLTASLFAAPAGGGMRFDVISEHLINEVSGGKGVEIGRRVRRSKKGLIYDLFFSKNSLNGQWSKMEFSFTPEQDGKIYLQLKGTSNGQKKEYPFIHVDNIEVEGAQLKNPGFESVKKNRLTDWKGCKPDSHVAKDPKEGKLAGRVSYARNLSQDLLVKKGVPVRISLFVRQEKPVVIDRGKDGMTNIYTDEASGTQVHISSGRLLLVPTFENCSYYINRTKKEWGKKCSVKVFYRKKGTEKWVNVIDPVDMEREKAWRGSMMLLEEDTEYEFKAVISGAVKDEIRSSFKTRSSNFKVAETIVLNSKNFNKQLKNIKSGKPDGYIRYTAEKGFVLKGGKLMNGGVIDCSKVQYVIFEGLTIDANGSRHGIKLDNCSDIVVRNCDISNFGQSDWVRDMHQLGRWTYKNRMTGWDGGIIIHGGKRQLIERCYIHTPYSASNSWFYSHPTGPEAIFVDKARGGTVIRYNDLVGSDARRWNDTIESSGNGRIDGGFGRDADIYGNLFAYADDDSIEIEGGEMNIRLYYNRFQGSYCGVSTGCCRLGPSYQFRNVYCRLGDENNRCGSHFKNGMGNQGDGAIYIINNTTYTPGVTSGYGGIHAKPPVYNPPLKAFTRNNIVISSENYVSKDFFTWNCDLDNDLFFGAGKEKDAEHKARFKEGKRYKNVFFADPQYMDPERGDFRLKKSSPARNKAAKIPGLATKHLGALQDDGMVFPHRPIPVTTDKMEIHFNHLTKERSFNFTMTAGKGFSKAFTVRCNDDFFTVTPDKGVLKSGQKITLTVRCDASKIKRPRVHNGMVLVRFEDGFSRCISVYGDFRKDAALVKEAYKHASKVTDFSKNKGTYTGRVSIPEDGCYFVLAEGTFNGWGRTKVKIGSVATDDKARFICRKPGIAFVRKGHLSGWYFFLKKGEFDFSFSTDMKGAEIKDMYITKEPEWFLR